MSQKSTMKRGQSGNNNKVMFTNSNQGIDKKFEGFSDLKGKAD